MKIYNGKVQNMAKRKCLSYFLVQFNFIKFITVYKQVNATYFFFFIKQMTKLSQKYILEKKRRKLKMQELVLLPIYYKKDKYSQSNYCNYESYRQ